MGILFFRRVSERHLRVLAILLALAILFGLFVLGAQSFAVGLIPVPWDKLAHLVVFAVLAAAIGLASGLRGWRMVLLAVGGALLVGVLDEWHQVILPGRQVGLDDLAADVVGGLIGALLVSRWLSGYAAKSRS
jgi:VanZ family protein